VNFGIVTLLFTFVLAIQGSCFTSLFAFDPLKNGMNFADGSLSKTWKKWYAQKLEEDIQFSSLSTLSLGTEKNRLAAYVDLGTEDAISSRYTIDAVKGSIYLSIHENNGVLVLAKFQKNNTFQPIDAKDIAGLPLVKPTPSFIPSVGHIYLINITDSIDLSFNKLVKLLVTDKPSVNSVAFRWDVIKDIKNGKNIQCFVKEDEPSSPGNNDDSTTNKVPRWIKASVISLFVLFGVMMVLFVGFWITYRNRNNYERI